MNRDKACLHPLVWPDVCGHGDGAYVGTVASKTERGRALTLDVYIFEPCRGHHEGQWVCLRSGPRLCTSHHTALDLFWPAANAYPPWHPARDLLLSQGFAP